MITLVNRTLLSTTNNKIILSKISCQLLLLSSSLLVSQVYAHTAAITRPDAGEAIRDIEQPSLVIPEEKELDIGLPDKKDEQVPTTADEGIAVYVEKYQFQGNTKFTEQELSAVLQDFSKRGLSMADLYRAAEKISQYYHQHGYVMARAYLPIQETDEKAAVITIAILEGRYDSITHNNKSRIRPSVLKKYLNALYQHSIVHFDKLEQRLLLLNDLPGIAVSSTFQTGDQLGGVNLLLDVERLPLFSGYVELDNHGGKYTGKNRMIGQLEANNPLGFGDRFSLKVLSGHQDQQYYRSLFHTHKDQQYYHAQYQIPVGGYGTRVGGGYSYMEYELGKDFKILDAFGYARVASLFVQHPLLRSRRTDIKLNLSLEHKRLLDKMNLVSINTRKRVNLLTSSLSGLWKDGFNGGGISSLSFSHGLGKLDIEARSERQQDKSAKKSRGHFNKIEVAAIRYQRLRDNVSLYLQFQGQLSANNLDSSEQMGIGGPNAVRAYTLGAANGDQGLLVNGELHYRFMPGWRLDAFVDHGRVQLNRHPWKKEKNHRSLSGVGVGLNYTYKKWNIGMTSAWQMNAPAEVDQKSPQLWLKTRLEF